MTYKSFNLGDWIGHISGVIEDENELDGNEMRDLVEFLSKLPRWIPVSERLPDKNGRYLVTVKQGYITFGTWVDVAENWAQVTAWMPLPQPYKEREE